jgi:hypothetical protein
VHSKPTSTWNGRIGHKIDLRTRVELESFNLTNRRDSAVDYYYESRLRNAPTPVPDIHFHPMASRAFRITLTKEF